MIDLRSLNVHRGIITSGRIIAWIFLTLALTVNIWFVLKSLGKLHDFGSFVAAGQLASTGSNPYSADHPLVFRITFERLGLSSRLPNANPPVSILLFEPLAKFNPLYAVTIWRTVSAGLYLIALYALFRSHPASFTPLRFFWAINLAGFWHTLELGQIYVPLLLFAVFAWILMEKQKYLAAGVSFGLLVALKPNFAVWPLLLAIGGYWQTLLAATIVAGIVSLIPVFKYGPEIYWQWSKVSNDFTVLAFPGNNSFAGLTARFGMPGIGVLLGVLLIIGLMIWIRKYHPPPEAISAAGIWASLLASPIAWTGYTLLTLPIFFSRAKWSWGLLAAAALFCIPFYFVLEVFELSFANFVLFGWLYGWGICTALLSLTISQKGPKYPSQ